MLNNVNYKVMSNAVVSQHQNTVFHKCKKNY